MKNLLLTAAILSASAAGMAQSFEVSNSALKAQMSEKMATKQVARLNSAATATQASAIAPTDVLDGVFYYRPEGVLYSAYTFGEGLYALHIPALTDITFINGCAKPKTAKWSINGTDLSDYTDEQNNLIFSWTPSTSDDGISGYYAPVITSGRNSFCVTDVAMVANEICPMMHVSPSHSMYTGFQDGPAFGSGSVLEDAITSQTGAVVESYRLTYEKPISNLYVEQFSVPFWTEKSKPLPEGTKLTLKLYKTYVNDRGGISFEDEPVDVIESEDAEILGQFTDGSAYYGEVHFAKTEKGVFGEDLITPMEIDYAYGIEIFGHNQAGVDVRYRLSDNGEDPYENEMGPHTFFYANNGDGTYSNYYFNGAEQQYGYELPVYVYALYDKVEVETNLYDNTGETWEKCNVLRVSADGKTVTNEFADDLIGPWVAISTALPFFAVDEEGDIIDDNYVLVDAPEWAEFQVDNSAWSEGTLNFLTVQCEALPEGQTGRSAVIYVAGKGCTSSNPIIILQGDAELSINEIHVNATQNAVRYNALGQRVNAEYKGIVIANGKKQSNL